MSILETRRLLWADEAACESFAQSLAALLRRSATPVNASIELHGPLGAGKTSLTRHLLRALGVSGRIKSPSYAVLESYALGPEFAQVGEVSHFDFYRFSDAREWEDAGFRDIFAAPGLKLSEWPDKAAGMLPPFDLQICLSVHDDESREVELCAGSAFGLTLLQALEGEP